MAIKLTTEQATKIHKIATSKLPSFKGLRVERIFDYIQTHAVYGIESKEELLKLKSELKNVGANKFRTNKNRFGFFILCFNGEKM